MGRRSFLKIIGLGGLAAGAAKVLQKGDPEPVKTEPVSQPVPTWPYWTWQPYWSYGVYTGTTTNYMWNTANTNTFTPYSVVVWS